jgi:hypothetical protein
MGAVPLRLLLSVFAGCLTFFRIGAAIVHQQAVCLDATCGYVNFTTSSDLASIAQEATSNVLAAHRDTYRAALLEALRANVQYINDLQGLKVQMSSPVSSASYILGESMRVEAVLVAGGSTLPVPSLVSALKHLTSADSPLSVCWMVGSPYDPPPTPNERSSNKKCWTGEIMFGVGEQFVNFVSVDLGTIETIASPPCEWGTVCDLAKEPPLPPHSSRKTVETGDNLFITTGSGWQRLWVWPEVLRGQIGLEDVVDFQVREVDRTLFLQHLLDTFGFQQYLEIGCDRDYNLRGIRAPFRTCVDPGSGGNLKITSDSYFANGGPLERFDLVFIDGMHTDEQVIRDVENALSVLQPGGVIVLHDSNPETEAAQLIPQERSLAAGSLKWNGDVWRAVVHLRQRADLDIATGDFDEGCAVIVVRESTDLLDEVPPYTELTYLDLVEHRKRWLRLMPFQELWTWINRGGVGKEGLNERNTGKE